MTEYKKITGVGNKAQLAPCLHILNVSKYLEFSTVKMCNSFEYWPYLTRPFSRSYDMPMLYPEQVKTISRNERRVGHLFSE